MRALWEKLLDKLGAWIGIDLIDYDREEEDEV